MTCCILEKRITTTVIPGHPGTPATPGIPGRAAYCVTNWVPTCEWIPNPSVTISHYLKTVSHDASKGWYPKQVLFARYALNGVTFADVPADHQFSVGTTSLNGVPLYVHSCYNKAVKTCYPAVAAVPPSPGTPPTPSQVITSLNLGWNSYSRSIDPVGVGESITFTLANNYGTFIALGTVAEEGQNIALFNWGLMVDVSGVKVMENGVVVATLASSYNSLTAFSIDRNFDGTLTYRADLAEYTTLTPPALSEVLYAFAHLYSGGDRVLCASTASLATAVPASCEMSGAGSLLVGPPSVNGTFLAKVTLGGAGTLTGSGVYPLSVAMFGGGALTAGVSGMFGAGALPGLTGIGGDHDFAVVDADLPALTGAGAAYTYTPPQPTVALGNLPFLQFYGYIQTVDIDNASGALPALAGVGGDYDFAQVNGQLPNLLFIGSEASRLDMAIMSNLVASGPYEAARDVVFIMLSGGELVSVHDVSTIVPQETMSAVSVESVSDMLAEFGLYYMSQSNLSSVNVQAYDAGPALNGVGRVWVVNIDTNAATQYDDYAFNSFFKRESDGKWYGVADDGVYLLEGDDDDGRDIAALVSLPMSDFGEPSLKHVPNVYIGGSSSEKLLIKVVVDDTEVVYEARHIEENTETTRVDLGRGLRGNNWQFDIMSSAGNFELKSVEFLPIAVKRRI